MTEFTICSLNVRGLVDGTKCRETFRWLRNKKYSVYFLQEVHSTEQTSKLWTNEWGYNAIFSNCTSSKAGVCILFNNNFSFHILKQRSDPDGRFAIVDIKTNEKILTLINIYAPNKDDPDFIQKVIDLLLDFTCDDIIFGGDFNLVQDLKKDKKGGNAKTHSKAAQKLSEAALNLDLCVVLCKQHKILSAKL